jgi:hypothetical protein
MFGFQGGVEVSNNLGGLRQLGNMSNNAVPPSFIQSNPASPIGSGYALIQANNGSIFCFGGSTQAIMKCTDGLDDWSLVYSIAAGKSLYWATKCQSGTMLCGGGVANSVFRSADNGVSWTPIVIAGSMSIVYTGLQLPNGTILVAGAGDARIWASVDDGLTFTIYSSSTVTATGIYRLLIAPDGFLLCAKFLDTRILRSIDNGLNWTTIFNLGTGTPPTVFCTMSNGNIMWKTGATSLWYRSVDNGQSFNSENYTSPVVNLTVNGINAKGLDYGSSSTSHYLLYSKNAGKSWTNHVLLTYQSYSSAGIVTSSGWFYICGNTFSSPLRAKIY